MPERAQHIDSWLARQEWEFKFTALRWRQMGGSMRQCCDAAGLLQVDVAHFAINDEVSQRCFWMEEFNNLDARREELARLIEELACHEPDQN